jgi:diguanylate cyclase (GGDEF)-like protein
MPRTAQMKILEENLNRDELVNFLQNKIKYLELKCYTDLKYQCKNRNWWEDNKKEYKNKNCTIIILDINGLKKINDTIGHTAGDEYIHTIIDSIKKFLRKNNIRKAELCRFGGDEFLLIIENENQTTDIALDSNLYKNILEFKREQSDEIAIGYAFKMKSDPKLYEYLKLADADMYKEKNKFYKNKNRRTN